MVTMAIAGRLSPTRVRAVLERNVKASRVGPSYWLLLVSGIVEPLLYLLAIGVGVGRLIGRPVSYHGGLVAYQDFVAPALLAFAALGGAFTEAIYGFFAKLKFAGVCDNAFAAGVSPTEIVLGELVFATVRGAVYSLLFLAVMVALKVTTVGWALAAFPAAVLVGLTFSALGLMVAGLLRGWQDLELVTAGQLAMFLFSGTFFPIATYPVALQAVVQLTPLYHAIELVRGLTAGSPGLPLLGHAAYLVAVVPVCGYVAVRLVSRTLSR